MGLPVPVVGQELGPQWAYDINNSLTLLDQHDHSNGQGVKITPSGLNINADLTFNGNNLISNRATTFLSQSSTIADLTSIYSVAGDLYYNDSAGNKIRITQNGGILGTPGSITGLVSPASASYIPLSEKFVWQSNSFKPATMDMGSIIVRKLVANSDGVLIQAPSSLLNTSSIAYSLTLPLLPAQQSFMTLDAAGNMAAPWTVDNSSIKIVSNQLVVQGGAIANSAREHAWELNGKYGSLTYPLNNIDAIFFAPYNITIQSVWIYSGTAGASGTTEFDLKVASSGGSFTSILNTTGKITSAAASGVWTDSGTIIGAQTGVTKPIIQTSAITAGQAIRWDLIQGMTGVAQDVRIRIFYVQT